MPTAQPACDERIASNLKSRLDDFRTFNAARDLGSDADLDGPCRNFEPEDDGCAYCSSTVGEHEAEFFRLCELAKAFEGVGGTYDQYMTVDDIEEQLTELRGDYGLSLDTKVLVTWQLSWGGPADEFDIVVDVSEGRPEVEAITYRFKDWFDGAARELSGDEFDLVRGMIDTYLDIIMDGMRNR